MTDFNKKHLNALKKCVTKYDVDIMCNSIIYLLNNWDIEDLNSLYNMLDKTHFFRLEDNILKLMANRSVGDVTKIASYCYGRDFQYYGDEDEEIMMIGEDEYYHYHLASWAAYKGDILVCKKLLDIYHFNPKTIVKIHQFILYNCKKKDDSIVKIIYPEPDNLIYKLFTIYALKKNIPAVKYLYGLDQRRIKKHIKKDNHQLFKMLCDHGYSTMINCFCDIFSFYDHVEDNNWPKGGPKGSPKIIPIIIDN
jgi:hypothetical protein